MRTPPVAAAILGLAGCAATPDSPAPGVYAADSGAEAAPDGAAASVDPLDRVLAEKVTERAVGCTAAVRTTARAWTGAAGLADRDKGTALTTDTLLRVGSITKSMTAAVVMSLVDEGKIDLDASAATYLPDVHGASRYTVRQLLGHRTGLVPYQQTTAFASMGGFGDPSRTWTPRELVALVEDLPLAFSPGTQLAYSNTNFILAGMIVEVAAHVPVANALRDRVYAKASMTRTWLDGAESIPVPIARGYSTRFDGSGHLLSSPGPLTDVTFALNPTVAWTTGAVVSTATEIAAFYQALLERKLVSPAGTIAMTTSPQPDGASPAYGLGLWRYGAGAKTAWGHTGDTAGYRSFAAGSPDGAIVVAVLCNDDRDEDAPRAIAEALATGR